MSDDTIDRLEKFLHGHKARWVNIRIDDGYGATCWQVELTTEGKGVIRCAETNFITGKPLPDCYVVVDGDELDDWPGLAATINLAIDKAEEKVIAIRAAASEAGA